MSTISLARLSWHTPEHTPIVDNLTLSFGAVRTGLVGRNGTGKSTLLRLMSGALTPLAGDVIRPATVGLLQQNPDYNEGATIADLFGVTDQLAVLTKANRGEATEEELADADWTLVSRLQAALGKLGLNETPLTAMDRLSGGQRDPCRPCGADVCRT